PLQKDRPSIQLLNDLHRRDASLVFAVYDGPVYRRRATIFWQEREVRIDAAMPGRAQEFRRQNFSVRDDNRDVGIMRREQFFRFCNLEFLRLMNREVVLLRELFDG